jgi:hypothetical protein
MEEAAQLRIVSSKHAAASSATQLMADLARVFKLVNQLKKTTTAEGRMNTLKRAVGLKFDEMKQTVKLKPSHKLEVGID